MPGSKLLVLGMVIPPFLGNAYNGVEDHPSDRESNGSLGPSTTDDSTGNHEKQRGVTRCLHQKLVLLSPPCVSNLTKNVDGFFKNCMDLLSSPKHDTKNLLLMNKTE